MGVVEELTEAERDLATIDRLIATLLGK
jgi:hypothetical protein